MVRKKLIELPDISSIPIDLSVPPLRESSPKAGVRVRQTSPGWEETDVYHALYLPANWKSGSKFPVIVEYAGNEDCDEEFGDESSGTVEGSNLGYGLTNGINYIWVCMPFVKVGLEGKSNAASWWGDPAETVRYCLATVNYICEQFGGNEQQMVLCGFSRGAIACNYIGLRDERIAELWKGFLCHSHYDGVRPWPYPDSDSLSARERIQRLNGRPQFISMEGSIEETRDFIAESGVSAPFTFVDFPFRNHTDTWALRECPLRRQAREWLRSITENKTL